MAWGRKTGNAEGYTRSVGSDALELAVRVEAARRSDRPDEARRIAKKALQAAPDGHPARVALALALMDLSDETGAREQLSQYLGALVGTAGMGERPAESSLEPPAEEALAKSSDVPVQMEDEATSPVSASRRKPAAGSHSGFPLDSNSSFATQTMAGLLDRQGDHKRADVIRERLDDRVRQDGGARDAAPSLEEEPDSRRVTETLNAWLRNIERERT